MKKDLLQRSVPFVCEMYRYSKGLSGHELAELFDKYNIWEVLLENKKNFTILPDRAIIRGIDSVLAEQGVYLETQIQL